MTRAPTRQERLRRRVPAVETVEGKLPSRPAKRAKPAARAAHLMLAAVIVAVVAMTEPPFILGGDDRG